MHERQPIKHSLEGELTPRILSEIERPHSLFLHLYDWGEAIVVDEKIVLAYKRIPLNGYVNDQIFVAREKTMPVKIERTGDEYIYPYPNEEELRGKYGVIFVDVYPDRPTFYVSEQYKVTYEQTFFDDGDFSIYASLSSTETMETEMIDGGEDYEAYLKELNQK